MATPVRNIFGTHVPTEADLPRAQRWLEKMGVVDAAEMGLEIAILNVIEVWNTNKTAGSVALAEVLSEMARGGLISEKKPEPVEPEGEPDYAKAIADLEAMAPKATEKVEPAPIEEAPVASEAVAAEVAPPAAPDPIGVEMAALFDEAAETTTGSEKRPKRRGKGKGKR